MYRLYAKVVIIIIIAYGYSNQIIKKLLFDYSISLGLPLFILLIFTYGVIVFCKIKKPRIRKNLAYAVILVAFTAVMSLRYQQVDKENPFQYWSQIKVSTGKNQNIYFLAKIKSLDGFKKERYQTTLELIRSYDDKRWMSWVFQDLEKNSNSNTPYPSDRLRQDLTVFPDPITVYSSSYLHTPAVNPGDIVAVRPYYIRKTEDINESSSYRSYLTAKGIYASWYFNPRDLNVIRESSTPLIFQIWEKIKKTINRDINYPSSTLAYAMFTGNKEDMPDYIKEYFRSTGTYHVLAVSGMHAGLLSIFFFYIFRILGMRKITSMGLIFLTVLPAYLFITDFQISIQRTYLMGLIAFILLYYDRSVNLMGILCLSFIAVVFYNPSVIYSVSFQLSFGAVFGIAHSLRILPLYNQKNAFINGLWVSVGAQLGTLPIVIFYFGYNNFLSLFYNIIVSVLISAYYLYTLIFLSLGIPLTYFPNLEIVRDFLVGNLGDFLTLLGNLLFAFLHFTQIEFDWFYFPSWQNQLAYTTLMGVMIFFLAEGLYQLRIRKIKKQFSNSFNLNKLVKKED